MSGGGRTGPFYGDVVTDAVVGRFHVTERLYRARQTIPRHAHERPYVCVVVAGAYEERSRDRRVTCSPSTLLLHPAGADHSDRFGAGAARLLMLEMDGAWLDALEAPPLEEPRDFPAGPVAAFGPRLLSEARERDDVSPLALEGLVLELLAAAHRGREEREPRAPAWLVRARERLEASFRRPPSMAELAAEAGVHPAHLAKSFRRHFRRSIGAFTRELRVTRAKDLLRTLPLADVALECGFADQSHLTRTFRRIEGMTPSEFRRRKVRR